jgi:uncharacterized damage-inducible protein DinB
MNEFFEQLVSYNLWANRRLGDYLLKIDPANLDREIVSSFPSIRKTVHHIWDAELIWLARIEGEVLDWPPSAAFKNPAIDQFANTSERFLLKTREFSPGDESRLIHFNDSRGKPYSRRLGDIIMHCMNHSTFHRGQLITLFRQCELSDIPNTDLINFKRE